MLVYVHHAHCLYMCRLVHNILCSVGFTVVWNGKFVRGMVFLDILARLLIVSVMWKRRLDTLKHLLHTLQHLLPVGTVDSVTKQLLESVWMPPAIHSKLRRTKHSHCLHLIAKALNSFFFPSEHHDHTNLSSQIVITAHRCIGRRSNNKIHTDSTERQHSDTAQRHSTERQHSDTAQRHSTATLESSQSSAVSVKSIRVK